MDFSQVNDVLIPQGQVKYITEGSTKLLWKRPFEFSTIGYAVYYQSGQTHNFALQSYLMDKYTTSYKTGISLSGKTSSTNSDGSKNNFFLLSNIWLPDKENTLASLGDSRELTLIQKGLANKLGLIGFLVVDENQADNFPFNSSFLSLAGPQTYYTASYSFSDVSTGKIKLSAVKDTSGNSRYSVTEGSIQRHPITLELLKEEIIRNTDVEVTAGTPLIRQGSYTHLYTIDGSFPDNILPLKKISSVRNDFDEYKVKYDTATGSKFPKSEYPYLLGRTKLTVSYGQYGNSLIKNVGGTYFYFFVKR